MTKFNKPNTNTVATATATNAHGFVQSVKSLEQQAYELAVTTLIGKDGFYEKSEDKMARFEQIVGELVAKGKTDFLANLMVYARHDMNIRNMPILGTVAIAKALRDQNKQFSGLKALTNRVIGRADQITDLLALTLEKFGGKAKLPMAIKRGLSDAFNKYQEYHFAKYNRANALSFKDAMRIVHPVPRDEETNALFAKVMTGELKTPITWETQLSAAGQTGESKTLVWERLIAENKLGYQAALKNLRNILEANVSTEHRQTLAANLIANVQRSKALPFEFLMAYQAIEHSSDQIFKRALIQCMDLTVPNLPKMGNVWVILDASSSMNSCGASTAACFFAAVIAKANQHCNSFALTMFDSSARAINLDLTASVFSNYTALRNAVRGGETNFDAAMAFESRIGFKPDAVFVLTDGEINRFGRADWYGNRKSDYSKVAKGAVKLVINMGARETTPLPERDGWICLAGWNTKILDYVMALKKGDSIVKQLSKPFV